jgi:hypothetical protein
MAMRTVIRRTLLMISRIFSRKRLYDSDNSRISS